jgi:hypothetical protein
LDKRLQNSYPKWFKVGAAQTGVSSITNGIKEDDKFWNEFLYTLCKGDVSQIREIKKLDVFEFFDYVENYEKDGRSKANNINQRSTGR